jgi:hypothetical protein
VVMEVLRMEWGEEEKIQARFKRCPLSHANRLPFERALDPERELTVSPVSCSTEKGGRGREGKRREGGGGRTKGDGFSMSHVHATQGRRHAHPHARASAACM